MFFRVFVIVLLLCGPHFLSARNAPDVHKWIKKLDTKDFNQHNFFEIARQLAVHDSSTNFSFLNALKKEAKKKNKLVQLQIDWLTGFHIYHNQLTGLRPLLDSSFTHALYTSYEINNKHLVFEISLMYGEILLSMGETAEGVMYCINAIDLEDENNLNTTNTNYYPYMVMADALFSTQQYDKCIVYARQAIRKGIDNVSPRLLTSFHNTIGLSWLYLGQMDSAYIDLQQSLQLAIAGNDSVWIGIAKGSIGEWYLQKREFQVAQPLLAEYYSVSLRFNEWSNAANALQMMARIHLAYGEIEEALNKLRLAVLYLQRMPQPRYSLPSYAALSLAFQNLKQFDSSLYYHQSYLSLRDSLRQIADDSRAEFVRVKLNHEQNLRRIEYLQKEKQTLLLKQTFTIVVIILLAIIALFLVNKKRLNTLHREQMARQQNLVMEAEMTLARERLEQFKQSVIEKSNIIERLQQEATEKELNQQQQGLLEDLSQQTILTEEDWEKFKLSFSHVYPAFFLSLKKKAPGITAAELRMAALIKLQLSSKHMASMLGISIGSVQKARLRLRQRLQLNKETNLEHSLTGIG